MNIGIIPNLDIENIKDTSEILAEKLRKAGVEVTCLRAGTQERLSFDMIISMGGDGTYLHTARLALEHDIPVLGMNMGRLGFLTQFDRAGMDEAVNLIARGEYSVEERFLEDVQVIRDGKVTYYEIAMNDLVIYRETMKLLDLEIHVDESIASSFYGDGLIVATPTGSTAYSLSAGGPIVEPESDVMLLTPICPHSISSTPMVVSGNRIIKVNLKEGRTAKITVDGKEGVKINSNDTVLAKRSEKRARVVKLYKTDFYKILREKFS